MNKLPGNGKVIIMGAGPGDPELLTLKAARYLQSADIILTDRLVSPEIIQIHASEYAEVIYVGKQCRNGYSTPQEKIGELMVRHALNGKLVVRLKGGDTSIFSNVLDELQTLVNHNINYEIIPGITAALGAAAYCGIPLTARNYASGVRFLTYYQSDTLSENHWKDLANTSDTLVFYMSSETLGLLVSKLLSQGISMNKKMAVIEQATTPGQHVYITGLDSYEKKFGGKKFLSPALIIIGTVVNLYEKFSWLENDMSGIEYFKTTHRVLKNSIRA